MEVFGREWLSGDGYIYIYKRSDEMQESKLVEGSTAAIFQNQNRLQISEREREREREKIERKRQREKKMQGKDIVLYLDPIKPRRNRECPEETIPTSPPRVHFLDVEVEC